HAAELYIVHVPCNVHTPAMLFANYPAIVISALQSASSSLPLHVLLDPFQQQAGDLVAVGVPHHDVVVAPDAGLRDLVVKRAARKLGQRVIDGVAAGLVDLAVDLEAGAGV